MVQTVCLDENKHAFSMLQKLKLMKRDDNLCDFTIEVKGKEFRAHKNVLVAGSDYFKAMLKHDTKESQTGRVKMMEMDFDCVKSCIDYIYSGKFDIPDGKIADLLQVADMLYLEDIKVAIADIMGEYLMPENFYLTRNTSEMFGFDSISAMCGKFYEEHFMTLTLQPGFRNEKKSELIDAFQSNKFNLSEEDKVTVSLRWIGENSSNIQELYDLFKMINLHEISGDFLNNILENDPIVSNDLRLYKMLSNPLLTKTAVASRGNQKREITPKEMNEPIILFDEDADCLRSYNPISGQVTKFHNEKFKHLGKFKVTFLDSYIYLLCGGRSNYRLNFKYKNSKWERLVDMNVDRGRCPTPVSHLGSIYAIGGLDKSHNSLKCVERFDPTSSTWIRLKDKPEAIAVAALVSLEDCIYCIGGWNEKGRDSKSFCKFQPSTKKWLDLPLMRTAKSFCGAVATQRQIYVMGGWRNSTILKDAECYDVATSQWSVLPAMLKRHDFPKVYYSGGCVHVMNCSSSDEAEKFVIADKVWQKVKMKGIGRFRIFNSVSIFA